MARIHRIIKDDAVKVLHSICQPTWKTQEWPQDWKRSVFIPIPKKGKKVKWLSEEALEIAVKRREVKGKETGKIYPSECRVPKNSKERFKKPSSVINAKK